MLLGNNITPCEGENTVKSYLCTEFNSGLFGIKAKGYLEITNKRLLFQAFGKSIKGWSALHNEVAIGDVSEIKIYKGSSFNMFLFIIGLAVLLLLAALLKGLLMMRDPESSGTLLVLIALGFGIYWLYKKCIRETFSLLISTKGGQGNVVYLVGMSPFNRNTAASKALIAAPGKDSEVMLKEIGAVISDIQNLGDYGVEKWKVQS